MHGKKIDLILLETFFLFSVNFGCKGQVGVLLSLFLKTGDIFIADDF